MLSQNHTANQINFWLTDWKNRGHRVDGVIIDASEALMNACVKTFAGCNDTNSYISMCADSLIIGGKPPGCFIRLDRSHFVKAVTGNKALKRVPKDVRNLLLGVVGYIIQCESLDECAIILLHIYTLTKHRYINDSVIASKNYLEDLVSTHDFATENSSISEHEKQADIFDVGLDLDGHRPTATTYKDTSMCKWTQNIYNSINVNNEENQKGFPNIFSCVKAEEFVFKVFVRLPMWSNIMCDKFHSRNFLPPSSACESEFKNIKHLMAQ